MTVDAGNKEEVGADLLALGGFLQLAPQLFADA